ncbi:hypothetical protein [Bacteroides sp.]|uniref:hypothetical protein n=1 Tax=Bacteroides sp. TaxID=29523 RepID=UPI0026149150|nr:hypothetical protein [Bacteroides sp.]MDD3039715.1 hypothetical protein [Bacteroides sp.]
MAKKDSSLALAGEIDSEAIRQIQTRIKDNSRALDNVVDKLVSDYCKPLDDYIKLIKDILDDKKIPPTDRELDDFTLNLPVLLYFTGEAQESLGIKEDVARAIKTEVFNEVFSDAPGTIADKTAKAELASQNEGITHLVYQRAYKKVKLRMEAANEVLQSVKKVMSRRMTEYEMTRLSAERISGK